MDSLMTWLTKTSKTVYDTCACGDAKPIVWLTNSTPARMLNLHRPSVFLLMLWPILWGFFSTASAEVGNIFMLIFLTIVLRAGSKLYNNAFGEDAAEETKQTSLTILISLLVISLLSAYIIGALTLFFTILWILAFAAYPYISRNTWWPQIVNGVMFGAFAVLIGQSASGEMSYNVPFLMAAAFFWVSVTETLRAGTTLDVHDKLKIVQEFLGAGKYSFISIYFALALVSLVIVGMTESLGGLYYASLMGAQALVTITYLAIQDEEEDIACRTHRAISFAALLITLGLALS